MEWAGYGGVIAISHDDNYCTGRAPILNPVSEFVKGFHLLSACKILVFLTRGRSCCSSSHKFVTFSRFVCPGVLNRYFPHFHVVSFLLRYTAAERLVRVQDFYSRLPGEFSIPSPLLFAQKRNLPLTPKYQLAVLAIPVVLGPWIRILFVPSVKAWLFRLLIFSISFQKNHGGAQRKASDLQEASCPFTEHGHLASLPTPPGARPHLTHIYQAEGQALLSSCKGAEAHPLLLDSYAVKNIQFSFRIPFPSSSCSSSNPFSWKATGRVTGRVTLHIQSHLPPWRGHLGPENNACLTEIYKHKMGGR